MGSSEEMVFKIVCPAIPPFEFYLRDADGTVERRIDGSIPQVSFNALHIGLAASSCIFEASRSDNAWLRLPGHGLFFLQFRIAIGILLCFGQVGLCHVTLARAVRNLHGIAADR